MSKRKRKIVRSKEKVPVRLYEVKSSSGILILFHSIVSHVLKCLWVFDASGSLLQITGIVLSISSNSTTPVGLQLYAFVHTDSSTSFSPLRTLIFSLCAYVQRKVIYLHLPIFFWWIQMSLQDNIINNLSPGSLYISHSVFHMSSYNCLWILLTAMTGRSQSSDDCNLKRRQLYNCTISRTGRDFNGLLSQVLRTNDQRISGHQPHTIKILFSYTLHVSWDFGVIALLGHDGWTKEIRIAFWEPPKGE